MVFRKPANFELPASMQYLLEDMDGNGEHIDQIAKNALIQRLRKNRFVFLADYPTRQDGLTEKQEKDLNLRPMRPAIQQKACYKLALGAVLAVGANWLWLYC